ncbi:hypothetical protein [Listeria fleischmannii]|uniref:hypothetical protein n=1 Tax=Listeria fleischmannii TaxID=1069827 RepID=UPI0002BB32B9|nr:hypothetical protein [Listeria fleischmannii]EMG27800.1 hypothetical protein LFLEISCH_08842 [Listeria fleischmannii subsp. fleischmannii LU2006-1]
MILENEERIAQEIANTNQIGRITFIRYFLAKGISNESARIAEIEKVYTFLAGIQAGGVNVLFSTVSEDQAVFLVTGRLANKAHFNLMFDFHDHNQTPIKKIELAGLDGLAQFDSTAEMAFYSNFLKLKQEQENLTPSAQGKQFFEMILSEEVVDFGRFS